MGKKVKHIIISGGGTGGHLFPAIAIGDSLKSKGHKVSYIGSKFGLEAEILKNLKSTYLLNIKGIQRTLTIKSIYNNLIFPYRFIISYLKLILGLFFFMRYSANLRSYSESISKALSFGIKTP